MSDAFATVLHSWVIPRMGVRRMIGSALQGNQGSVRVFEKNGFVLRETLENHVEVKGELRGVHVLQWSLDTSSATS